MDYPIPDDVVRRFWDEFGNQIPKHASVSVTTTEVYLKSVKDAMGMYIHSDSVFPENGFVFFIDMEPEANWGHDCAYASVPICGNTHWVKRNWPPAESLVMVSVTRPNDVSYRMGLPSEAFDTIWPVDRLWAVSLFGGDRMNCCDEAVFAEIDGTVVGVATIAPLGESRDGVPEIVGVYVIPRFRRQGIGLGLMVVATKRCIARGLGKPTAVPASSSGKLLFEKWEKWIERMDE